MKASKRTWTDRIVGSAITLVAIVPLWMLKGYVISQLWTWFLVPLDIPAIGIAQALGLAVLSSLFLLGTQKENKDDPDATFTAIMVGKLLGYTGAYLFCWATGYIFYCYM